MNLFESGENTYKRMVKESDPAAAEIIFNKAASEEPLNEKEIAILKNSEYGAMVNPDDIVHKPKEDSANGTHKH